MENRLGLKQLNHCSELKEVFVERQQRRRRRRHRRRRRRQHVISNISQVVMLRS